MSLVRTRTYFERASLTRRYVGKLTNTLFFPDRVNFFYASILVQFKEKEILLYVFIAFCICHV